VKLLLYLSLIACVFHALGLRRLAGSGALAYAIGLLAWAVKLAALAFFLVLFETAHRQDARVSACRSSSASPSCWGCLERSCCSSRGSRGEARWTVISPICSPAPWCS